VRTRAAFSLIVLAGCGGPPLRAGPLNQGHVDTDPAMECLPDPDVADSAFTQHMRFGITLAQESFLVPPPEAPPEHEAANLQAWAESTLSPWLERKTHTVDAARRELDLAAEEDHRQRIIGGAIVGLMYEDVARVLRAIPAPDELEDEPEILDVYRQILESQARPFVTHAHRAYNACSLNARRPTGMRHWMRFCAGRRDRLPDADTSVEVGPSGETTVEVIAE
jgi:hypothetical protein